jgi:Ser/Thr protein kinase RdoA (MazF antagonist)
MKLKYLFDNRDLALMLLNNWHYDEHSMDILNSYRISASAVYPFKESGNIQLLRFSPKCEKMKENLYAEIEFINYLRRKEYGAIELVKSKSNDLLILKKTPWGEYYASVSKKVSGKPMEVYIHEDDVVFEYGRQLGKLHALSKEYQTDKSKRWSYENVFDWIEIELGQFKNEKSAFTELKLLKKVFSSVPKNAKIFGLIHYDFELDNVFYDEDNKSFSVIDFDDAMYHWYVVDIEQVLDSLQEVLHENDYLQKRKIFLEGYNSEFDISNDMLEKIPIFKRFINLYGYTRILRSAQEKWENEPEWLVTLRRKLNNLLKKRSKMFCKEIG